MNLSWECRKHSFNLISSNNVRMDSNKTRLVYPNLSYKVMDVLFGVQNRLGSGLLEKYYQRAIELELTKREIDFEREKLVRLEYEGTSIGRYFVDFVIDEKLVLEIKATKDFKILAYKQAYSYLRQLKLPLALVVNFHGEKLKSRRIINPDFESVDLSK